jgi:hypothetical protein
MCAVLSGLIVVASSYRREPVFQALLKVGRVDVDT